MELFVRRALATSLYFTLYVGNRRQSDTPRTTTDETDWVGKYDDAETMCPELCAAKYSPDCCFTFVALLEQVLHTRSSKLQPTNFPTQRECPNADCSLNPIYVMAAQLLSCILVVYVHVHVHAHHVRC